jgi:hypothetical protein
MSLGPVHDGLAEVLAMNHGGSTAEHVVIALPSFSVGDSILSHYRDRIPSMEHRYLLASLMIGRIPAARVVFVSSRPPEAGVLDHYERILPEQARARYRQHLTLFTVPEEGARPVAAKLLDRPDLVAELRALLAGRPTVLEPWNVTDSEVALAQALGAPINGTPPSLRVLGYKSTGRRLIREAGVPLPAGREDVRTVDDVVVAVRELHAELPGLRGVVVKHDDSGAGDGNQVVDLVPLPDDESLRRHLASLPEWYLEDLAAGGVVEELVSGDEFTSPSCQIDVLPDGSVSVVATHEQLLGGESGQVFSGCRFPADPAYAPQLAAHATAVGRLLAERGAIGRAAVDFACTRRADGPWQVYALEINLRKGGTTHPFAALRNLVPGRYDSVAGQWVADADGELRCYVSSDGAAEVAPDTPVDAVVEAVRRAGLEFDPSEGTGVVLHMLSRIPVDGRFGVTAVARSPEAAQALYEAASSAVAGLPADS